MPCHVHASRITYHSTVSRITVQPKEYPLSQISSGLSLQSLGLLNYLHSTLAQPTGSWEGFYEPQSPSMNFALRYQLAFGAYAVAALAQRTPAYRAPYAEALKGAIEKLLDVTTWGYWRAPAPAQAPSSGWRTATPPCSSRPTSVAPQDRLPTPLSMITSISRPLEHRARSVRKAYRRHIL